MRLLSIVLTLFLCLSSLAAEARPIDRRDLQLHYTLSVIGTGAAYYGYRHLRLEHRRAITQAAASVLVLGFAKEAFYDTEFDGTDLMADGAGVLTAVLIIWPLKWDF